MSAFVPERGRRISTVGTNIMRKARHFRCNGARTSLQGFSRYRYVPRVKHAPGQKLMDSCVAPLFKYDNFVPGTLAAKVTLWDEHLFHENPDSDRFLGFVRDTMSSQYFVDPAAEGVFQGRSYTGADLPPAGISNIVHTKLNSSLCGARKRWRCDKRGALCGGRTSPTCLFSRNRRCRCRWM